MTIDLTRLHTSGFYALSPDLQRACEDLLNGAAEVFAAHADDPERGDIGWRKQSEQTHLEHARVHLRESVLRFTRQFGFPLDDDGLAHWKHAAARLVLAVAREKIK
jgi:hypothetical protein